jgi:methanogenic corrinoid protein MtbC1
MKDDASGFGLMTISAVERDTGIPKDTLRVWERRYGFPRPSRDESGERLYTLEDLSRLRLVRRLMDQGWRPGKLLGASEPELLTLIGAGPDAHAPALLPVDIVAAIRRHDVAQLRSQFQQALLDKGLQSLITDLIAPLNVYIGEAWMRGELGVPDEHFYTEQLQSFLRGALAGYMRQLRPPRVLLTTLPDEEHALGLLMVEVMLAAEGAHCCSLGPRMPLSDIRSSASTSNADIVALSFSSAFPLRQALSDVRALRDALPEGVEIWAGGSGAHERLRGIRGVIVISAIADIPAAVARWRSDRQATAAH